MTKKEIVKTISEDIGLTQLKTNEIVQKTFNAIVETLVEEKRIELRNFGVFEVKKRAARKARNPRTGTKVYVPEKYVVTFKPGKQMEERVRQLELEEQEAARLRGEIPEGELPEESPSDSAPIQSYAPPAESSPVSPQPYSGDVPQTHQNGTSGSVEPESADDSEKNPSSY